MYDDPIYHQWNNSGNIRYPHDLSKMKKVDTESGSSAAAKKISMRIKK